MKEKDLTELSDQELMVEKKKFKKSKIMNAFVIGFLGCIAIVGIVSSIVGKNFVLLIPILIPIYFIYKIVSNSKKDNELELLLKKRKLN